MILLTQGYLNNKGSVFHFPQINEGLASACLKMLAATVITVEEINGIDRYTLCVEYGEHYKSAWHITNMLKIWFYEGEGNSTANVISLLTEAIAKLYEDMPDDLKDRRGIGTEVILYIVKIVQALQTNEL